VVTIKAQNGRLFEFENTYFYNPKKFGFVDVWQVGELSLEAGFKMFEHSQACHEISFIVSGEGVMSNDGQPVKVQPGDIHYIPKGSKHSLTVSKTENLRMVYLGFELNEEARQLGCDDLEDVFKNPPTVILRDTGNVRIMLYMLINEMYGSSVLHEKMVETYITQIIVQLYRFFKSEKSNVFEPDIKENVIGKSIYSIVNYVDSHIFEIESIKSLSRKLGYSHCYLSHMFKERMGITLQKYVTKKRIEAGMDLLRQKKYSITQIAHQLNYESSQSFGKAFKRVVGCTPSEYQKSFSEKSEEIKERA
jgi:AraC-like DNA-binding protein